MESRKHYCPACEAKKRGIKSRKSYEHEGCEFAQKQTPPKNSFKINY